MSLSGADLTVVGAGIVGLTLALEWARRHPQDRVDVLDKEPELGAHASGRNSGVLHSGVYYPPNSLKARFAREGNRRLAQYCDDRGLPLRRCGKLIVARSQADNLALDQLAARAAAGAVPLEWLDPAQMARIEPRARTVERALFAPETAAVDPQRVLQSLMEDAVSAGVRVLRGVAWLGREGEGIRTSAGRLECGYLVNAAGLYADRIASAFGFGERYALLPFRGLYLRARSGIPPLACHIYPVPDLQLPFLGVHFTVTVDGGQKIGPTAQPALWREQYGGLRGFDLRELMEIAPLGLRKLLGDRRFRSLAAAEVRHMLRGSLVREAASLVDRLEPSDWREWAPVGIRPQLIDRASGDLVLDFHTEGDARSFHVLNAISPGLTCSLPFASWCCDAIEVHRG